MAAYAAGIPADAFGIRSGSRSMRIGEKKCKNGIITGGTCDRDAHYKVPADSADFYTTWSFMLCMIAVAVSVLVLVPMFQWKVGGKYAMNVDPGGSFSLKALQIAGPYVVLPIVLFACLNSVGVLITSQLFLSYNFVPSLHIPKHPGEHDLIESMEITFVDYINKVNTTAHIVPGFLSAFMLLVLSTCRLPDNVNPGYVTLATIVAALVFVVLWASVPATDDKGRKVYWLDKVKYVYNDPSAVLFVPQLLFVILGFFLVPYCMLKSRNSKF